MLGATTGTTSTQTTIMPETTTMAETITNSLSTIMDSTVQELTCSTCAARFEKKDIRVHMRDEWHVCNLKRKVAGLGPISRTTFQTQIPPRSPSARSQEEEGSETGSEIYTSSSAEEDERSEVEGGSEQELEEGEKGRYGAVRIGDELRLQSGKILGHRSHARPSRRHQHYNQQQDPHAPTISSHSPPNLSAENINLILSHRPSPSPSPPPLDARLAPAIHNTLIRKGTETSLLGVPERQQRALATVARKMEAGGLRKESGFAEAVERKGNCQKRFRVKSMGKKAGGLEKRLG